MGNKFQIKLHGRLDTIPTLNVFGYEVGTGSGSASDLGAIFWANVPTSMINSLSHNFGWLGEDVINLDNPDDFWSGVPSELVGAVAGDSLPPQDCWAYEYNRATRSVRNGQKRFCGVPESWQADGVADPTHAVQYAGSAEDMAATLTGASGATYIPRIFRYVYPIPNPSHLPPTSVDAFPISNVTFKGISSQNTRKINRH